MNGRTFGFGLQSLRGDRRKRAFTLVELLVVIAIIGILASLTAQALSGAKQHAHGMTCMNNQRQLTIAWILYADEHEDYLPWNYGKADTKKTVAQKKFMNWVNNVMSWELDSDNTNEVLAATGGISPYLSGVVKPYRCPSDWALSDLQKGAGWSHRVRSHSMNAMLGYAGEYTPGTTNLNNPYYRQFFKSAEIPTPSDIFVFIEEHPDTISDGYFLNPPRSKEWVRLPASYHRGGANLSFADGHLEFHKWVARTKAAPQPDRADDASLDPRTDFNWLMSRTSVPLEDDDDD